MMEIIQARVAMHIEEVPNLEHLKSALAQLNQLYDAIDVHSEALLGEKATLDTPGVENEQDIHDCQEYMEADAAIKVLQDVDALKAYGRVNRARKYALGVMEDLKRAIETHPITIKQNEELDKAEREASELESAVLFEKEKVRWRAHLNMLTAYEKQTHVDMLIAKMETFPYFEEGNGDEDDHISVRSTGHYRFRSFWFKMDGVNYEVTMEIVNRAYRSFSIEPAWGPGALFWDILATEENLRKYFDSEEFTFK